jgi:hypothetical protein
VRSELGKIRAITSSCVSGRSIRLLRGFFTQLLHVNERPGRAITLWRGDGRAISKCDLIDPSPLGSEHPPTSALMPCNRGLLLVGNTSFSPRSTDHKRIQRKLAGPQVCSILKRFCICEYMALGGADPQCTWRLEFVEADPASSRQPGNCDRRATACNTIWSCNWYSQVV